MPTSKRILICPLDWGLGHASRCIPVIRLLMEKGAEVIVAADGRSFSLLKQEFPDLQFIRMKGYGITYPKKGSMLSKMLFSIPKILKGIKNEYQQLDKIIDENKIDIVISDNRYGCWNKKVKSIFITHQLMIKSDFGEMLLHKIILSYIKNYDECWIPDNAGENNFSGDLAHKYSLPENTFYIGPLSRFTKRIITTSKYDVMAIISGPEPQRSIFETLLLEQLQKSSLKALMVSGKTEYGKSIKADGNLKIVTHLRSDEMQEAVLGSKLIIARSGYSTIMDIAALGRKIIFIPTPGQTEQEYLAERMMSKGIAYSLQQKDFNLELALKESENYKGFEAVEINSELENRIHFSLFSK